MCFAMHHAGGLIRKMDYKQAVSECQEKTRVFSNSQIVTQNLFLKACRIICKGPGVMVVILWIKRLFRGSTWGL